MKSRGSDSVESWLVAVASGLVFLMVSIPMRLGAQLFVSIIDRYDSNREAASFPFSLSSLMRSVSGPFAGYFGELLGLQRVTVIGCFLCTVGVGACFFAEDIITLDIWLGIIYGTGFGWATALGPEILNQHFVKHRAKANGIFFGASGLGAFITPPILEIIMKEYGVSATFLIICGVVLNGVPAALLMTKPSISLNTNSKISSVEEKIGKDPGSVQSNTTCSEKKNTIVNSNRKYRENEEETKMNLKDPRNSDMLGPIANVLKNRESKQKLQSIDEYTVEDVSNNSHKDKLPSNNHLLPVISENNITKSNYNCFIIKGKNDNREKYQSLNGKKVPILISVNNLEDKLHIDKKKSLNEISKNKSNTEQQSKFSCESFKVLWSPMFLLLTLIQSSHSYVMYTFWTITVDVALDKGITRSLAVYLVMSLSLLDTIGRFFLAAITDHGYMTCAAFSASCFVVMAGSCMLLTWVTDFFAMMVIVSMIGLTLGGNSTVQPVIINTFIEKDKRTMAMASRLILYAPMSFSIPPLIGYFRGDLGSYDGFLYVIAGMCAICSGLLYFLPEIDSCYNKMKSRRCEASLQAKQIDKDKQNQSNTLHFV